MKGFLIFLGFVAAVAAFAAWAFSGPSRAEVDASHDSQCVRWGAKRGSSDYIQCRATLQMNYEREKAEDRNAALSGVAVGMAAANAGARK